MDKSLARNVQRPPGQGQSKSARRRRRRRQALAQATNQPKQQQQRAAVPALNRRRQRPGFQIRSSFVRCAIDPFNHSGPLTGVPDRFSGLSIVAENRTLKVFTSLKRYNYFLILPSFGANLVYQSSDTEIAAFEPQGFGDQWSAIDPTIDCESVSLLASKFRTMSLAAKVRYVGPAAVRNGWFRVARFNWQTDFEAFLSKQTSPKEITNRVIQFDTLDLTEGSIMATPSAVSLPIDAGVYATSVRVGSESWDFKNVFPEEFAVSTKDLIKTPDTERYFANFTINSYDQDWTGLIIFLGCATTSSGYFGSPAIEVEVRHCVELVPAITSTNRTFRTISRQSPRHDEAALNQVANIQREMPSAIPHADSWLDRLARGAGRFVGNLAMGAVSPALGAVTAGLNALGLGGNSNSQYNPGLPALM